MRNSLRIEPRILHPVISERMGENPLPPGTGSVWPGVKRRTGLSHCLPSAPPGSAALCSRIGGTASGCRARQTLGCWGWVRARCRGGLAARHEEGSVLALVIPASVEKPHFTGPAYVRSGAKTVAGSRSSCSG